MSDFTKKSSASAIVFGYEEQARKASQVAQKMAVLASSLPASTPAPKAMNPFGYCAEQSLMFDLGALPKEQRAQAQHQLLELYPPVALVDLTDGSRTQKPLACLRDAEKNAFYRELFPVVLKLERAPFCEQRPHLGRSPSDDICYQPAQTARWWSQLACGLTEIGAESSAASYLGVPPEKFEGDSFAYGTGAIAMFARRMRDPKSYPEAALPLGAWESAWSAFVAARWTNPALPSAFVHATRARTVLQRIPLTLEDLPAQRPAQPGEALKVAAGSTIDAVLEWHTETARRYQRTAWDRIGNFWAVFDEESAQALVDLANAQLEALPDVLKAQQAALEPVREWVTELMSQFSSVSENIATSAAMRQQVPKRFGSSFSIPMLRTYGGRHTGQVTVPGLTDRNPMFLNIDLRADLAKPAMTYRDLEVDYV
jgi:hypothetical protein